MIVSSHQPSFLPWAGYWNKLLLSSVHVVSAGVKFDYAGYQNRVPFNGSWLTLPVVGDAKNQLIKDVRFNRAALPKLFRTLTQTAGARRNPFGNRVRCLVEVMETFEGDSLFDFNTKCLFLLLGFLDGRGSSVSFDIEPVTEGEDKTARLVARLRRHVSTEPFDYYAGQGALSYIDPHALPARVRLMVQVAKEGVCRDSILQLIAREQNPAQRILDSFTWVTAESLSSPLMQTTQN